MRSRQAKPSASKGLADIENNLVLIGLTIDRIQRPGKLQTDGADGSLISQAETGPILELAQIRILYLIKNITGIEKGHTSQFMINRETELHTSQKNRFPADRVACQIPGAEIIDAIRPHAGGTAGEKAPVDGNIIGIFDRRNDPEFHSAGQHHVLETEVLVLPHLKSGLDKLQLG